MLISNKNYITTLKLKNQLPTKIIKSLSGIESILIGSIKAATNLKHINPVQFMTDSAGQSEGKHSLRHQDFVYDMKSNRKKTSNKGSLFNAFPTDWLLATIAAARAVCFSPRDWWGKMHSFSCRKSKKKKHKHKHSFVCSHINASEEGVTFTQCAILHIKVCARVCGICCYQHQTIGRRGRPLSMPRIESGAMRGFMRGQHARICCSSLRSRDSVCTCVGVKCVILGKLLFGEFASVINHCSQ